MVCVPAYDPNALARHKIPAARPRARLAAVQPRDPGRLSAGLDVQGGHRRRPRSTPASTRRTRSSAARSPKTISGVPLQQLRRRELRRHHAHHGADHSVNTVWAEVGEKLGKTTMAKYMNRFGFYRKPPIDYPADQLLASRRARNGELLPPASRAGRRRAHGDRPGQAARHAAADGRGGGDRSPTAACGWSRTSRRRSSTPTGARGRDRAQARRSG